VAAQLQIDNVQAQLLPDDKQKLIAALQLLGQVVAWPVMASTMHRSGAIPIVGIAMGKGTDVAINAADIVGW